MMRGATELGGGGSATEKGRETDERDRFLAALSDDVLRAALAQNEFEVTYQPILDLTRGTPVGAEALLRWRHPEHGVIEPDHFIPFAERNEAIIELGAWTIEAVCARSAAWRSNNSVAVPISVNVSPAQLERAGFADSVVAALRRSGLPPWGLELEITENLLVQDLTLARETLLHLSEFGVRLALDDFGSGFTSLNYVHRLPVEKLKIDKSYVDGIDTDAHGAEVVRAIVRIGHSFNLRVVGEGVESAAQLTRLRELGCDEAQGYYVAAPMSPADFAEWVHARRDTGDPGSANH